MFYHLDGVRFKDFQRVQPHRHLAGSPVQGLGSILVSFVGKPGGEGLMVPHKNLRDVAWIKIKVDTTVWVQPIPRVTGVLFDFATSALPFRSQSSADLLTDQTDQQTWWPPPIHQTCLGWKLKTILGLGNPRNFGNTPMIHIFVASIPHFSYSSAGKPAAFLVGSWSSARPQT